MMRGATARIAMMRGARAQPPARRPLAALVAERPDHCEAPALHPALVVQEPIIAARPPRRDEGDEGFANCVTFVTAARS
jgi:hypothetical protein